VLSRQYGVPSIDLSRFDIDPAVLRLVPAETAQKYQFIPLSRAGATLTIAMTDPTNVFAMDDVKFMTGYNVEPVVASESMVADAIQRYYNGGKPAAAEAPSALEIATRALETCRTSTTPTCRCSRSSRRSASRPWRGRARMRRSSAS